MSIILKGIDLPEKNMKVVYLFPNGAEELVVLDADSRATAGRPIQAIQIPKGHGRLIDADKYLYYGDLVDEPTILEAEE